MLHDQGKLDEAEILCRQIVEAGRKSYDPQAPAAVDPGRRFKDPKVLAAALAGLGDVLRDKGQSAQAEPLYREGLEICHSVAPDAFEERQWLAAGLAAVLRSQGRLPQAEAEYWEAITNAAKTWPEDPARWQAQVNDLVNVLQRQGKLTEADQLRREFLARPSETNAPAQLDRK